MTYPAGTILIEKCQNLAIRVTPEIKEWKHIPSGFHKELTGYIIEPVNWTPKSSFYIGWHSVTYVHTVYRPIEENDKAFLV